jgi:hypothetical protein
MRFGIYPGGLRLDGLQHSPTKEFAETRDFRRRKSAPPAIVPHAMEKPSPLEPTNRFDVYPRRAREVDRA